MTGRHKRLGSTRLVLEGLECRTCPAGDVAIIQSGATLFLTGDALGNVLEITYDSSTSTHTVTGIDTTLNGATDPLTFDGVANMVIRLNQGNDNLYLGIPDRSTGNSFFLSGNLVIDLGAGHDDLTFSDSTVSGNTSIRGRQGNDNVIFGDISSVFFGGSVAVRLDQGNDSFAMSFIGGHVFGKNLLIDGGSEGDFLMVDSATISSGTLTMLGGAGGDSILIQDSAGPTVAKKIVIDAGAGDDSVSIASSTVVLTTGFVNGNLGTDFYAGPSAAPWTVVGFP